MSLERLKVLVPRILYYTACGVRNSGRRFNLSSSSSSTYEDWWIRLYETRRATATRGLFVVAQWLLCVGTTLAELQSFYVA
jgi:hypothetical protein